MAQTETEARDRLTRAWESALTLPDERKGQVADYIEFLMWCDEDDDVWEPDEEDEAALEAWRTGVNDQSVPFEEVVRESREKALREGE